VAALLGAALARDVRMQRSAALLTFVIACVFDLLFFVVAELPATVPVALTVIVLEVWSRRRAPRRARVRSAARGSPPRVAAKHGE
jgi:hypothetical protein